jgi:hypothetical protein
LYQGVHIFWTPLFHNSAGEWESSERQRAVAELAQHDGVDRNAVTNVLCRLAEEIVVAIVRNRGRSECGTRSADTACFETSFRTRRAVAAS